MLIGMFMVPTTAMPTTQSLVTVYNYGVIFRQKALVKASPSYWKHSFRLELPTLAKFRSPPVVCQITHGNQTCGKIPQVVKHIYDLRKQAGQHLRKRLADICRLIPEADLKTDTNNFDKRAIVNIAPFFKTIFGFASEDDINTLASHIGQLELHQGRLRHAFIQHAKQMTSYMDTLNSRIDNAVKGMHLNHKLISEMRHTVIDDLHTLENSMAELMIILANQTMHASEIDFISNELATAALDLTRNQLHPAFIPFDIMQGTIDLIDTKLAKQYPGYHVHPKNLPHYYRHSQFIYTRKQNNIYISVKFPVSSSAVHLMIYTTRHFPVPVNDSSHDATEITGLSDYIAISEDHMYYALFSHSQIMQCAGDRILHCPFTITMININEPSCETALFFKDSSSVKDLCKFTYMPKILKPSMELIDSHTLMLTNISRIHINCQQNQYSHKGCALCFLKISCACEIYSDAFRIESQITDCLNTTNGANILHPVNLALLQQFFEDDQLEDLKADTLFDSVYDVKIPPFRLYKNEYANISAEDQAQKLDLKKMSSRAKMNQDVYQSLADPILHHKLPQLIATWPSISDIILIVSSVLSVLAISIGVFAVIKCRSLALLLLINKPPTADATLSYQFPTTQPPLGNELRPIEVLWYSAIPDTISTLTILLCVCIFIVWFIKKKCYSVPDHNTLYLELSTGNICIDFPLKNMRLCPKHFHFRANQYIQNINITGTLFTKLHVDWNGLTVTNMMTGKTFQLQDSFAINPITAYYAKFIIKKNADAYLKFKHGGHGYYVSLCAVDCEDHNHTGRGLAVVAETCSNTAHEDSEP